MLPGSTSPAMPMGRAATLPLTAGDLMPAISAPAGGPPPAAAAGLMTGQGGAPMGFPAANAPAEPPFNIEMQPDGSAIWKSKTEPSIVIGVVPAPKLPVSLQPPKGPGQ